MDAIHGCGPPSNPSDCAARPTLRRTTLLLALAAVGVRVLPALAQTDRKPFTPEELDQMLAPIALYPDSLLSQVMMAASYPIEIVEATRWSKANPGLKGDAAVAAVRDKTWDTSVKSLVAFPPVLAQLNDHLDWTQKLGDAMIEQQQDVADSIQRLRARAANAGNLQTTKEQAVTIQKEGDQQIIAIEPADPQIVYAPSYDPNWAYGTWPYPASPPVYYPFGGALATGLMWGVGFAAAGAMFGGWNWGYGRGNSYVNVNPNRAVNIDNSFNRANVGNGNRWQHDTTHRKGVAYRDAATRQQFGQSRPGAEQRQQFRGQPENRPGQGNVANARPGGGPTGGAQRPGGGAGAQRPGGGAATAPRAQQRAPEVARGGGGQQRPQGGGGSGFSGVNRGQQVNREAQRGRAQQARAGSNRPAGGGGGRPGGGGGGRPAGGGRPGGGGGRR